MIPFKTIAEYRADIKRRFTLEGRPVTAREGYYTFESIKRDYPGQFPKVVALHKPVKIQSIIPKVGVIIPKTGIEGSVIPSKNKYNTYI